MKLKPLAAFLSFLALAACTLGAAHRNAFEVVLGDNAQDTDCSFTRATPTWTASPSFSPSPTPSATITPTPDTAVDAIQALGFAAEWEDKNTLKVTLSDVSARFDTSKAKLKPEAVERLKKLSTLMGQFPGSTLQVDGHTDPHGFKYTNTMLSLKRAETVRDVMISMGVPAGTFVAVSGWAATKPLSTGDSPEEIAQNRRVEIRVHMSAAGFQPPTATASPTPLIVPSETPTPSPMPTEIATEAPTAVPSVGATPAALSPEPSPAVPQKP